MDEFEFRHLFAPSVRGRNEMYNSIRNLGGVADPSGTRFAFADRATCSALLRDGNMSSVRYHSLIPSALDNQADPDPTTSFLLMDPPDHTRLRRLVVKAFSPRVVKDAEEQIHAIVDELISGMADRETCDIVSEYAFPLPLRLINGMMGIPREDHESLALWSQSLVRGLDPVEAVSDQDEIREIKSARFEMVRYFVRLIASRRSIPGDDLLSELVAAQAEGDRLSMAELVSTCILLLVAGHETTGNLIANAIHVLLRHPVRLAEVRNDPSLAEAVVEEALRLEPPVQLVNRTALEDTTVAELKINAGSRVMLLLAGANRDPEAFVDPDAFDPGRSYRAHLSFGAGIHYCLGARLARLQGSIAIAAFARRFIKPSIHDAFQQFRPHLSMRGLARLDVDFEGIR